MSRRRTVILVPSLLRDHPLGHVGRGRAGHQPGSLLAAPPSGRASKSDASAAVSSRSGTSHGGGSSGPGAGADGGVARVVEAGDGEQALALVPRPGAPPWPSWTCG